MHVMVDIETLGTTPGSAILSIGAVRFDPLAGTLGDEGLVNIDLGSATACGLRMDPETVAWWMAQSEAARQAAFFTQPRCSLGAALNHLHSFLRIAEDSYGETLRLWSHGATFDPVLLASAYEACHLPLPWTFREVRDTRTLFDLAQIPTLAPYRLPGDEHHNPLSDAKVQARAVIDAYRRLRLAPQAIERPFRTGDHVAHGPSGETWVVAYADPATGSLGWCGWPEGEGRIVDCTLAKAASDAEHRETLLRVIDAGGARGAKAQRLYGTPMAGDAP